jgi:hypothetical protein
MEVCWPHNLSLIIPNTPALVLLSAGRGGPDQDRVPGSEKLFTLDKGPEITRLANELVQQGKPKELMLIPGWWYVISAESYFRSAAKCTTHD